MSVDKCLYSIILMAEWSYLLMEWLFACPIWIWITLTGLFSVSSDRGNTLESESSYLYYAMDLLSCIVGSNN